MALDALSPDALETDKFRAMLDRLDRELEGWLRFRTPREEDLPEGIEREGGGLTAMELRDIFAPLSPTAAAMKEAGQVIRHYGKLIRWVPNPQFRNRRSGFHDTAAEYLFDRVDALAYGARQWGGPTCRLLA